MQTEEQKLQSRLTELEALISQKEELLAELEAKKVKLIPVVKGLQATEEDLDCYLKSQTYGERKKWDEAHQEQMKLIGEAKKVKNNYQVMLDAVIRDKEEHEAWKAKETEEIHCNFRKIEKADENLRERRKEYDEKKAELNKKVIEVNKRVELMDNLDVTLKERRVLLDSSLKDLEIRENDLINARSGIERDKEINAQKMTDISDERDENLKQAGALRFKEEDLEKREEECQLKEAEIGEEREEISSLREEAIILSKKAQVSNKQSELKAHDLHNREHKLAEKEKLFTEKIGGKR